MANDAFEDLVETFAFLEDWEDRYRHVIDMGRALPTLSEAERGPATKVDGCASQVWLVPELSGEGEARVLTFRGESDAMIVQGLIAILQTLYNGLTVPQARQVNAEAELGRLGLRDHLSAQRSNGLRAMIGRIEAVVARA